MSKLNIQKRKESFEKQILKALLIKPYRSIYTLHKDFGKRKNHGVKGFSMASYQRYIKTLEAEGYLTTSPGGRGAKILDLTFKGLTYLVLHGKLSESDTRLIVKRVLGEPDYRKLELAEFAGIHEISIVALAKSFDMIRSRVNLQYFDEEYVKQLFFDVLVVENLLNEIMIWKEQYFIEKNSLIKNISEREQKKQRIQQRITAKRNFDKIPQQYLLIISMLRDYLRERMATFKIKLKLVNPIVKEFEKRRKKHNS